MIEIKNKQLTYNVSIGKEIKVITPLKPSLFKEVKKEVKNVSSGNINN
jgi:hypothetical protein